MTERWVSDRADRYYLLAATVAIVLFEVTVYYFLFSWLLGFVPLW